MEYIIGVDLGGTQLRAALFGSDGALLAHERTRTLVEAGPDAVIARIVALIELVRAALPPGGTLVGVGIGAPGPLNPTTGVVLAPSNMPGWHNIPLRDAVANATGLEVTIGNDADAAGLGEWRFGAGIGTQHMVYVTVSTGIGGGVIVDGRLLTGRAGVGAELGHMIMDVEQGLAWEDLASGTALGRAAAAAMPGQPSSLLHGLATAATVTAADVARAAGAGDSLALALMEREARFLGLGFASILHIFSPELLLVGGSVALENPQLFAQARAVARRRVIADLYREVPIELARLGERAGIYGAAALVLTAREAA